MLLSKCTYKSKQENCLIETMSVLFPMEDAASFLTMKEHQFCTTKKYLAHWYLFQTGCVLLVLLIPIFTGARLDGKRYIRHVNTEPFLLFTYVIRLKNDMQECLGLERTHAVLNLTRSVFYCCRASCEN